MAPEELALITEVAKEVAECLGVNPAYGDEWVGRFQLMVESDSRDCELYSSVLHIGKDSLHLMNHHVLDVETGKAYLVDFSGRQYNARILRMIDPETRIMTITVALTAGGVVQSTEAVNINFTVE